MAALALALGLTASCSAPEPPAAPAEPLQGREAVVGYLRSVVEARGGPPSISVAVASGGEVVLAAAAGRADEALEQPADPETVYRTYSISKGITAVAVMQLVQAGAVSLDDPIRRYVAQLPGSYGPVTVRHLLTHTSGVRHYKEGAGEISSTVEYPSLAASLAVFSADPLEFEPGTAFLYTSFGFNLLTGVVETASGLSFRDYLQQRVFRPAGMTSTDLDVAGARPAGVATAYWPPRLVFDGNHPIDDLTNVSGRYGASGVLSTPTDLVRLWIALEEGVLLRPETVELMTAPAIPELEPAQALSWNVTTTEAGRRSVYRTGAGTGFVGILLHYPDLKVTGALLVNQNQWQGRVEVLGVILEPYLAAAEDGGAGGGDGGDAGR